MYVCLFCVCVVTTLCRCPHYDEHSDHLYLQFDIGLKTVNRNTDEKIRNQNTANVNIPHGNAKIPGIWPVAQGFLKGTIAEQNYSFKNLQLE